MTLHFRLMQGTNAHAAMEVLDSEDPQSVFGSGRHVGHTWRRTPFWLLPPASALLRSCSVVAAGAGAARQVLMQGQLRSSGLAELLLSGGSAPWALALEAAYAAATALSAVHDGKQLPGLGLAEAVVGSAHSGLDAASELHVAVDARNGSIAVSVGDTRLLTARVATATKQQPAGLQQQRQQQQQRQLRTLCSIGNCLPADASLIVACVDAASSQAAAQQHGLLLQPALLQASMQLRQLPPAADNFAGADDLPNGQLAAFGLLLLGMTQPDGSRYCGSRSAARQSCRRWQANACAKALRLSSEVGGCSSLRLQGLQFQAVGARSRAAAAAASPVSCSRASYTAVWQAVQPATALPAAPGVPAGSLGRAEAVVRLGSRERRSSRHSQAVRGAAACRIPRAAGSSADAGQAACLRATQLLQVCSARGVDRMSLTTAAPPAAAAASPTAGSRWGSRAASAALHAVLLCVASEQPGAQFTAGSLCEAACCDGEHETDRGLPAWDAQVGCHGQQLLAGAHLAARLLPAAAAGKQEGRPCTSAGLLWAISGGTGSLGLLASSWLQQQEAAAPLLLGRSGRLAGPAPQALLQAYRSSLALCMCDAGMQADAAALPGLAAAPLAGLLHAGGILRDAAVQQQTAGGIRAVHAPKSAGLRCLLAQAAVAAPLRQCLLFSSIAAVTGPAGSSSYAAANAALDVAAVRLQLQGGKMQPWHAMDTGCSHLFCPDLALFTSLPSCSSLPRRSGRQQPAVGRLGWHRHGC